MIIPVIATVVIRLRRLMIFLMVYVLLQGSFGILQRVICLWMSILMMEVERIRLNFLGIVQVSCLLVSYILIEIIPVHLIVLLLGCCYCRQ
jgi:hypothetical protein